MIIDDLMASEPVQRFCEKIPFLNSWGVCSTVEEAEQTLNTKQIDLIFLDKDILGPSAHNFLDYASTISQIIFLTDKQSYGFEAFQCQATDYLFKPLNFSRFHQAVNKAMDVHRMKNAHLVDAREVYLKEDSRFIRVAYDDILYFENIGDYVRVKTSKGAHVIHGTLKSIGAKLNRPTFLKVHRSYIINLEKIKDIEESSLVIEQKVIPISRANRPVLLSKLNLL